MAKTKTEKKQTEIKEAEVKEEVKTETPEKEKAEQPKEDKEKPAKTGKAKIRSRHYLAAKSKIDRQKEYSLAEAIKLAKETSTSKFKGTMEAHLVVRETGLSAEVKFPHEAGKPQTIRIADDELIKELEKGKTDFTILIATPAIMPKLAKYARLLGPKGLMPSPKAGTISDKPEKLIEELKGKLRIKTEAKAPLMHVVFGKVDDKEKDLIENLTTLIGAVAKKNISKIVICASMGPGVKVSLENLN